jgi:hypothetical protein
MSCLAQRVAQREGPHIQQRVALTDGAAARQQQVVPHFPAYTWVLDILHATEYLWDTATALLGEPQPHRLAWVRAYLEPLLAGQTDAVSQAQPIPVEEPPQRLASGAHPLLAVRHGLHLAPDHPDVLPRRSAPGA